MSDETGVAEILAALSKLDAKLDLLLAALAEDPDAPPTEDLDGKPVTQARQQDQTL